MPKRVRHDNKESMKIGFVYIMSNRNRTTFYIGVTNDIERRTLEHKTGNGSVFTSKYNCVDLLYYEDLGSMGDAIAREKQLKNWHREWKINLIKQVNPEMIDLAEDWFGEEELIAKMNARSASDPETSSG